MGGSFEIFGNSWKMAALVATIFKEFQYMNFSCFSNIVKRSSKNWRLWQMGMKDKIIIQIAFPREGCFKEYFYVSDFYDN
jgi:hypothetical protein